MQQTTQSIRRWTYQKPRLKVAFPDFAPVGDPLLLIFQVKWRIHLDHDIANEQAVAARVERQPTETCAKVEGEVHGKNDQIPNHQELGMGTWKRRREEERHVENVVICQDRSSFNKNKTLSIKGMRESILLPPHLAAGE